MKNLLKYTIVLVAVISATSCNDFLEQPVNGKLAVQDFYKTDADATQAVTAIYDVLSAQYFGNWASLLVLKTMPSDESNAGGSNDGDQKGYQDLDDFIFDSQNDKINDVWKGLYQAIYRANKVINEVPGTNDLQKRLVAEAKALRAMSYFELINLWGPVPLILVDIPVSELTNVQRNSKEDIYVQIEQDLTEAIAVLPSVKTYAPLDKFRISKGTAQALLGKALLYQEKWSEASVQFEEIIGSGDYALGSSIQSVFSASGEFGTESILEFSYTNLESYDWGNFPWGNKPESNIHVQLMGPRSDYYTKAPGDSLLGGWGFNLPTSKMNQAFVAAGDVSRRAVTIMSEAELEAAGGNWDTGTNSSWDFTGFWQRKYGSFEAHTGAPIGELNYGTNWRVIRYADVLLMAAEANHKDNKDAIALGYLNQVRTRPGTALPASAATGNALFEAIVLERQLELAFEGHRFNDLLRWGRAADELESLGFKIGKHEVLPIPIFDVRSAGIEQNPNY